MISCLSRLSSECPIIVQRHPICQALAAGRLNVNAPKFPARADIVAIHALAADLKAFP
jgi:hypothetical protein